MNETLQERIADYLEEWFNERVPEKYLDRYEWEEVAQGIESLTLSFLVHVNEDDYSELLIRVLEEESGVGG